MQLQTITSQAVQLLHFLHRHSDEVQSGQNVAVAVGITYQRFVQIASHLRRDGLLISNSGRYGGYTLGRPAQEISFHDVALSVQGRVCISHCKGDDKRCQNAHCKMYEFLLTLQDNMIADMENTFIADLK